VKPLSPLLIFDQDCGFCVASVQFLQRHTRRPPVMAPWRSLDLASFGLTRDECLAAAQWVTRGGRVYAGERAVAHALVATRSPLWSPIGAFILLPGVRHVAAAVYRRVAKNRHRLPGAAGSCAIGPVSGHNLL
jgi:predicted DCC family thiol-disulfide oxidoreductase YuxK